MKRIDLEFLKKWANGEILTNTAPADRRQLKNLIEAYEWERDNADQAHAMVEHLYLENKLLKDKTN